MKIIQGLKQIKALMKKQEDLVAKVGQFSAHLSIENPTYPDQKKQIREWIQAHSDILKEILRLRIAIQKTNLATTVAIEIDGKSVTKTIAEWIHRRRDLAQLQLGCWIKLTEKGLKEGFMPMSSGEKVRVEVVRCYDVAQKDKMVDLYRSEPMIIDSTLEIINAVTDIIE